MSGSLGRGRAFRQFLTALSTLALVLGILIAPAAEATPSRASAPTGACATRPFPDVPTTSTFCSEIRWLSTTGVTSGYLDGTFRPSAMVLRQAMAAFLHRYGFVNTTDPTCSGPARLFPDVATGGFCGSIEWLAGTGITGGYLDGTFKPTSSVTRGAMAAFLYRFARPGQKLPKCTVKPFKDVPTSNTFCSEIKWLSGTGITGGYLDGTFRPNDPVTRGAMAAFLYRANATRTIPLGKATPLPQVTSVAPTAGPTGGGTAITVTGSGFTDATTLLLDVPSAASPAKGRNLTVVSSTKITAVTPARYAGTVPVRVITPHGTSVPTSVTFTYRTDWAQTRHDAARTGWNPSEKVITPANAAKVAEEWNVRGSGSTAVVDGVLYASTTGRLTGNGEVSAYELATGRRLWSFGTGVGCAAAPMAVTATLIVLACTSAPRAFQRGGSHQMVWNVEQTDPGQYQSSMLVSGSTLVAWGESRVSAYRLSDGQRVWQQLVPSGGATGVLAVAAAGGTVVVAYYDRLRGISLATGAQQWSRSGFKPYGFTQLVIAGGWVYTNSGAGVRRYAVATGTPGWSVRANGDIYRIEAADGDTVYAWEAVFDFSSPYPSVLHALRTSDGSQRWQVDVPSRIRQVAIAGDVVWLSSTGINSQEHASDLFALRRTTGARLRHLTYADNMYGEASFAGGKVIISQGGSAYEGEPARLRVLGLSGRVPGISTSVLPIGRVGKAYSADLAAAPSGATWSVTAGSLPKGLTLSTAGKLRGTPTAAVISRITVRAKGSNGRTTTAVLTLQVVASADSPWPSAGRDAMRNPFVPGDGRLDLATASTFGYRWKTATPGSTSGGAYVDSVISGGRIYATLPDGTLRAYDTAGNATNRPPLWTAKGTFTGPPTLAGDRLIVRTTDQKVHGIRLSDGADLFSTATEIGSPAAQQAPLIVGNSFVMPAGYSSSLMAYSTADGSPRWAQPSTATDINLAASSDGTRIYAMSGCDLVALSPSTGAELWRTQVTAPADCGSPWDDHGAPLVVAGKVYATTISDRLVADAATGKALLRFAAGSYSMGRSVVAGGLWIFIVDGPTAASGGSLVAVDTVTGQPAWAGDYVMDRFAGVAAVGDLVIVSSSSGIQGFSRITGEQVWDGGTVAAVSGGPVIAGKRIFVTTNEGIRAYGPL